MLNHFIPRASVSVQAWDILIQNIQVFCDRWTKWQHSLHLCIWQVLLSKVTALHWRNTFLHELSVYVTERCFTAKRPALPVILRHSLSASFSVKSLATMSSGLIKKRISSWTSPDFSTPPPMYLLAKSTCPEQRDVDDTHLKNSTKQPCLDETDLQHACALFLNVSFWRDVKVPQGRLLSEVQHDQ